MSLGPSRQEEFQSTYVCILLEPSQRRTMHKDLIARMSAIPFDLTGLFPASPVSRRRSLSCLSQPRLDTRLAVLRLLSSFLCRSLCWADNVITSIFKQMWVYHEVSVTERGQLRGTSSAYVASCDAMAVVQAARYGRIHITQHEDVMLRLHPRQQVFFRAPKSFAYASLSVRARSQTPQVSSRSLICSDVWNVLNLRQCDTSPLD